MSRGSGRFAAREGVEAHFGEAPLGVVADLDIGPFDDPNQLGLQYYVFSHHAQQDVVRFTAARATGQQGKLATLHLAHEGAGYRVEALCADESALPDGRFALRFEAQHEALVTASAHERHGVADLASALLLDALSDD